jgi:hypothetical protein
MGGLLGGVMSEGFLSVAEANPLPVSNIDSHNQSSVGELTKTLTSKGGTLLGSGKDWAVVRDGNTVYLVGHSNGQIMLVDGNFLDAKGTAEFLQFIQGTKGMKTVELFGCHAGKRGGLAQSLSNILGVPVTGPNGYIIAKGGMATVANRCFLSSNVCISNRNQEMSWESYFPQKK